MKRDPFQYIVYALVFCVAIAIVVNGFVRSIREGECTRKCAPRDSVVTQLVDGMHCVCIQKGGE